MRRGAATVEMAVVTPILLGLLFAIIEYGWIFMLQANVTNAAREACRVGILPGATDADIRARFAEAISGTGLSEGAGYQLEIERSGTGHQTLTVRARVPWAKASLVGGGILPNPRRMLALFKGGSSGTHRTSDMVASCSMFREGSS
ncbi:MAG TPA: pilus assembly protein [Phycisphaerae bacterium]|nr:pilus assembly protein [Phycisphaerae bacterium]HOJ74077.1 pilus assembly protein [Phycisphaerae bacterium]HOM50672.1 pilus assembly protein [Phycisphaerae bacterium]HON67564.1 pilus assembly protein [Phycisphaerae bacterium]HOQ85094.1 pilus assembly protein [Phycisphaerae bacterium]